MAYETKDNSGTIFRNDKRGDNEKAPNGKGKALIGGVWYWVSAWTKEPRGGGDKFQSLSFEPMADEHAQRYAGNNGGGNATQRALNTPPRQQQRQPDRQGVGGQSFNPDDLPF